MSQPARGARGREAVEASGVARRLDRYVAIDSVNPTLVPGTGEAALATAVAEDLAELGARVVEQEVAPGRSNVIGYVEAGPELPTITFDAHLDTVPLGRRATTVPRWENGRLFARGACDTKASLAAIIEAVRLIVERPEPPRVNITVLGSVDEEVRCRGAEFAHELVGDSDLIVVGEPTGLNVGTWHKGTTRFEIETIGRTSHSSRPELGTNAIELMVATLTRVIDEVIPGLGEVTYATGESATASIGAITGGGPLNQVPDRCRVGIDVRRVPGLHTGRVLDRFDAALRPLADRDAAVRHPPFVDSPAFETTASPSMLEAILMVARRHRPAATAVGLPYGTNASRLARSGAPSVVLGPGSIEVAHTDDEHVDLDEVVRAANLFVDLVDQLPQLTRLSAARRQTAGAADDGASNT